MFLNKKIKSQIEVPYFFFTGKFENINSDYFINKIKKGIEETNNLNFKTNVKGHMTDWKYFKNDIELWKLLWPIFDLVEKEVKLDQFELFDAWGHCLGMGGSTTFHKHLPSLFSGAIYLNDHIQELQFPEINESLKPEKGSFAVFSSLLKHGCPRNSEMDIKWGLSFNCIHKADSFK